MTLIEKLIGNLSKLPGLGSKSASRIVYYLLKSDTTFCELLANDILEIKSRIKSCRICGNYTEVQPCSLCSDTQRDRTTICVVEEPKDVLSLESIREYRGLYHVLMGVISPIDGVGPESLRITELIARIREGQVKEVILATNPTVEGDATALYLVNILKRELQVKLTRLALGLPVGGDLEFADRMTLTRAIKDRNTV